MMMVTATNLDASLESARYEFRSFFRAARAPKLRSMLEFAEAEITLPTGPFKDFKFKADRQPWTRHWLNEIDSGQYTEHALTAVTQVGKSLLGFIIPTLYHLFEIGETVVCGLPSMDISGDKWREDFLPVIELTRYANLLPIGGRGSKGANNPTAIKFRNGSTLRFMSGGGNDKSRAAFTSRVIVITEADGLDTSSATSKETSKIHQIEARARSFGDRKRIYKECTVSDDTGHIWSRYLTGTHSRLMLPCPHCSQFVLPDRENLHGWQDSPDEIQAREKSAFHCPSCGESWTDAERYKANHAAKLIHRGQSISSAGIIEGEHPQTRVLGFRASAVHNQFLSAAELGADEWNASREPIPEVAEKRMMQFVWALPYKSPDLENDIVSEAEVRRRITGISEKLVPADAETLVVANDMGKRVCHWTAVAFRPGCCPHVVDFGTIPLRTDEIGIERAFAEGLAELARFCEAGWQQEGGGTVVPRQVWIDSRYKPELIMQFLNTVPRNRYRPTMGKGSGQFSRTVYQKPKTQSKEIQFIGEEYHIAWHPSYSAHIVHVNADHWKSWLHARIMTPRGDAESPAAGSFSIFEPRGGDRHVREYARHLTSEHREQTFEQGKGQVVKWVCDSSANHWLDATALCCVAGHFCGVRMNNQSPREQAAPQEPSKRFETADGRPFLITERN